jgi:hypothetical protein
MPTDLPTEPPTPTATPTEIPKPTNTPSALESTDDDPGSLMSKFVRDMPAFGLGCIIAWDCRSFNTAHPGYSSEKPVTLEKCAGVDLLCLRMPAPVHSVENPVTLNFLINVAEIFGL